MRASTMILGLGLLTICATALFVTPAAAHFSGACAQANTFVLGMAHSCPLGYPEWPKPQSSYLNYYQNLVGERAGWLAWIC